MFLALYQMVLALYQMGLVMLPVLFSGQGALSPALTFRGGAPALAGP